MNEYLKGNCETVALPSLSYQESPTATWGDSNADVFVSTTGGGVRRFDGTSWSVMDTILSESLLDIWGLGANDVYAVGENGRIIHYDGESWKQMDTGIAGDLRAVWGTEEAVYAVGNDDASLPQDEFSPAIYRYDGTSWARVY